MTEMFTSFKYCMFSLFKITQFKISWKTNLVALQNFKLDSCGQKFGHFWSKPYERKIFHILGLFFVGVVRKQHFWAALGAVRSSKQRSDKRHDAFKTKKKEEKKGGDVVASRSVAQWSRVWRVNISIMPPVPLSLHGSCSDWVLLCSAASPAELCAKLASLSHTGCFKTSLFAKSLPPSGGWLTCRSAISDSGMAACWDVDSNWLCK